MEIINRTKRSVISKNAHSADRFLSRLRGLLCRPLWVDFTALYLKTRGGIHTIGMTQAIDIITVNHQGVVRDCRTIQPWRIYLGKPGVSGIIECPAGTVKATKTGQGDQLEQMNGKGW